MLFETFCVLFPTERNERVLQNFGQFIEKIDIFCWAAVIIGKTVPILLAILIKKIEMGHQVGKSSRLLQ